MVFVTLLALSLTTIYFAEIIPQKNFFDKLFSVALSIVFLSGALIGRYFEDDDPKDADCLRKCTSISALVFSLLLLAVRYLHQVTGISWPVHVFVYDKNLFCTGYVFTGLSLQYPLAALIFVEIYSALKDRMKLREIIFSALELVCLGLIDGKLMFVTATVLSVLIFIRRVKLEKQNVIFLIATNVLSFLALAWGLYRQEYIVRTDFTTLQTIIMMSIIVLNGLILTVLGCRKNKSNIKLLTLGIFMLWGVLVIPHMCLLFNSLLWFVVLILVLLPNEEYDNTIDKYIENLITSRSKSIDQRIYEANPHVTITARTLGELIRASLIGSNHKYSTVKTAFKELEFSKSESKINFELAMIRAILEEVEGSQRASSFFETARKLSRGNAELYTEAFFNRSNEVIQEIHEDLDLEEIEDTERMIDEYNSIRTKLSKLKS